MSSTYTLTLQFGTRRDIVTSMIPVLLTFLGKRNAGPRVLLIWRQGTGSGLREELLTMGNEDLARMIDAQLAHGTPFAWVEHLGEGLEGPVGIEFFPTGTVSLLFLDLDYVELFQSDLEVANMNHYFVKLLTLLSPAQYLELSRIEWVQSR